MNDANRLTDDSIGISGQNALPVGQQTSNCTRSTVSSVHLKISDWKSRNLDFQIEFPAKNWWIISLPLPPNPFHYQHFQRQTSLSLLSVPTISSSSRHDHHHMIMNNTYKMHTQDWGEASRQQLQCIQTYSVWEKGSVRFLAEKLGFSLKISVFKPMLTQIEF